MALHLPSLILRQTIAKALSCRRKLAKLVSYHLFGNVDGNVNLAVVNEEFEPKVGKEEK